MSKPLKCTSCNKAVAGIHVLDIEHQFEISRSMHLCEDCAAKLGVVPTKMTLQSLIESHGQLLMSSGERKGMAEGGPVCPGCYLTHGEFKLRGRLGCPRCYEVFRQSLLPLLERVHEGTRHRGRFPARLVDAPSRPIDVVSLRTKLSEAIAAERYEEAAELRDQIQKAKDGDESGHGG